MSENTSNSSSCSNSAEEQTTADFIEENHSRHEASLQKNSWMVLLPELEGLPWQIRFAEEVRAGFWEQKAESDALLKKTSDWRNASYLLKALIVQEINDFWNIAHAEVWFDLHRIDLWRLYATRVCNARTGWA